MTSQFFKKEAQIKRLTTIAIIGVLVSLTATLLFHNYYTSQNSNSLSNTYSLTPWGAVGGCGAGGGSSGGSVDWMGQGVSGGYVDLQVMPSYSATPKIPGSSVIESQIVTLPLAISIHLRRSVLGISVPFLSKSVSLGPDGYISTAGLGDIGLSLTKSIGSEGQISVTGGVTFPTGRIDIYKDQNAPLLLPASVQMGSGLLSGSLSIGLTKDKDWGLLLFGVDYSGGFFYTQGVEFSWDDELGRHNTEKRKLAWARQGKGAMTAKNDEFLVSADNLGLKVIAAIKQKNLHHSIQTKMGIPLNHWGAASLPGWMNVTQDDGPQTWKEAEEFIKENENPKIAEGRIVGELVSEADSSISWKCYYDETTTKFKTWPTLTLGYGMEIFNEIVPFFWGISVPIKFDMDNSIGVSGFSIQAGVKFIVF